MSFQIKKSAFEAFITNLEFTFAYAHHTDLESAYYTLLDDRKAIEAEVYDNLIHLSIDNHKFYLDSLLATIARVKVKSNFSAGNRLQFLEQLGAASFDDLISHRFYNHKFSRALHAVMSEPINRHRVSFSAEERKFREKILDYIYSESIESVEKFLISRLAPKRRQNGMKNMNKSAVKSFDFKKEVNPLVLNRMYRQLNNKMRTGFVDSLRTTEDHFVKILLAEDFDSVNEKIYFVCETRQVRYIIDKMSFFFNNLELQLIEKSEMFISKTGVVITASNLSKAVSGAAVKESTEIDKVFQQLQK